MSFWSGFKRVLGVIAQVEHTVVPVINPLLPLPFQIPLGAIDTLLSHIPTNIAAIEANNPGDKQGAAKSQAVIAELEAGLAMLQEAAAIKNKRFEYDKAEVQLAINDFVSAYNRFPKIRASFKEVDL